MPKIEGDGGRRGWWRPGAGLGVGLEAPRAGGAWTAGPASGAWRPGDVGDNTRRRAKAGWRGDGWWGPGPVPSRAEGAAAAGQWSEAALGDERRWADVGRAGGGSGLGQNRVVRCRQP
jgi:hypothetical protein